MNIHHQIRQNLMALIALVGLLAAIWSASMLVGGFFASGQLESKFNPLGQGVAYIAALAIVGATALFYYVLANRHQTPFIVLLYAGAITAGLTIFASLTQTFMVVDGSVGEAYMRGTESRVNTCWRQTERIDREITEAYQAQIDHYRQRMAEERVTGEGPRFGSAERAHNQLREKYQSALGSVARISQQGRNLTDDVGALRGHIDALHSKASLFDRFASEVGIRAIDYGARLTRIEGSLGTLSGGTWINRKSVIYAKVVEKTAEMIKSGGTADLGFTLNVVLAFMPDLIQILCAMLLIFLRPKEGNEDSEPWSPGDAVWGENVSETIHQD